MAEEDSPNDEQPEGEPEKIEDGGSSGGSGGEGPDVIHQTVTGGVQPPVCRCGKALIPVCGANGIVYGNVCLAKCAKQKMTFACKALDRATCPKVCFIDSVKACRKACAGRPPKPACAADGKVYRNPCLLKVSAGSAATCVWVGCRLPDARPPPYHQLPHDCNLQLQYCTCFALLCSAAL